MPVYHVSPNKSLKIIEPRRALSKGVYIGDYVFATKDKMLATMYLATKGYAVLLGSKDKNPNIVICADAQDYLASDHGGAVYELPEEFFFESPQTELAEYELVSKFPVKPLSKMVYEKSIDAMHKSGIDIKFVDQETFDNLIGNLKQRELVHQLPNYHT